MMGRLRPSTWLGAGLLALAGAPADLVAQYDAPPPPAAYGLRNVTVVGADGARTPGVNLVVRDGLIEALGVDVAIPADALVLEGDSLLVYPGLVDAQAAAEHEFPEPKDREDDDEQPPSWDPPRSASGFMPHRKVAEHLTVTGPGVRDQRAAGIVAGLVHPTGGMAPGQPAVVVYRPDAEAPWQLVQDESAGLTLSFQGGRGVYPSQLFGVIAYLRQAFLDAERYATMQATWDRNPGGMTAPPWDPDAEALLEATTGGAPVYFAADSDEDIRRVLDLARELGFSPVIVGGDEAWKLAPELAERSVPVLVSVDFPRPDAWDPEADTVEAELEPDQLREKERIENVWSNAGRLEEAGVRFALTSGGGTGDLLEGARKAVEYGLSPEAAVRALTLTPAELLGIAPMVRPAVDGGATFLVADGDLLEDETGIVYTFVEGHLEEGRALTGGGEEPVADISGTWEGSVSAQGMDIAFTLSLTQSEDGSLSGTMNAEGMGEADVEGSISGSSVRLRLSAAGMPEPIVLTGTVTDEGTRMRGGGSTPMGSMEFTATKQPGAAGSWSDLFQDAGQRTERTRGGAR